MVGSRVTVHTPWPLRQPSSGFALASLAHFVSRCLLACTEARGVNCNVRV